MPDAPTTTHQLTPRDAERIKQAVLAAARNSLTAPAGLAAGLIAAFAAIDAATTSPEAAPAVAPEA